MSLRPHLATRPSPPPLHRSHALFLDVDGCLIEFADTPDGVSVPPALLRMLPRIADALDGALALVSGRVIASLDAMFSPLVLPVAGQHGHERRDVKGRVHPPVGDICTPAFEAARAEAHRIVSEHPGAIFEDKPLGFALHWRRAPGAGASLRAFAESVMQQLPGYALQPGDHVMEIKPEGADKGTAIEAFLAEAPFAGRTPVFLGDDLTDEYGFDAVNACGGVSVLIGGRAISRARFGLRDPASVTQWLGAVLAAPSVHPPQTLPHE